MDEHPETWSLGAVTQDWVSSRLEPISKDASVQDRAISSWCRLVYQVTTQELTASPSARRRLSVEHMLSYQLLLDWWTAKYHDPALSIAGLARILGISFFENFLQGDPKDIPATWNEVINARLKTRLATNSLALLTDPAFRRENITAPRDLGEGYHDQLCLLFKAEFLDLPSYDWNSEPQATIDARRNARNQAAINAYCQQFAWKTFCSYRVMQTTGRERTHSVFSSRHTSSSMPNLALRGPIVNPCPWIQNEDEELDLPYYLWDIRKSCTIKTSCIKFNPDYMAISHTWGRWVKGRPISIPGVPWKVPQNRRFNVRDVGAILRRLVHNTRCGVKYVWLDLVCIPQDGSIIAKNEIARQAKIFRSAKYAMAWFNDIGKFEGLSRILNFASLHLLQLAGEEERSALAEVIDMSKSAAGGAHSNLYHVDPERPMHGDANPWFTSLWTLQELCLRPDMWLCGSEGKMLMCDNDVPVPLCGMIALLGRFTGETDTAYQNELYGSEPLSGLRDLVFWYTQSGLEKLLALDIASILSLGEIRHCTQRRAEAIMSALGVTEWFVQALTAHSNAEAEFEKDLVLGKYPLAFVKELATKHPRHFFAAVEHLHWDESVQTFVLDASRAGSMLPFGGIREGDFTISARLLEEWWTKSAATVHDTVSTWTVEATGAVRIPRACVIDTSTDVPYELPAWWAYRERSTEAGDASLSSAAESKVLWQVDDKYLVNLNQWMSTRTRPSYAVLFDYFTVVLEDEDTQECLAGSGIILETLESGMLRKVCLFCFQEIVPRINVAEVRQLDWLVL